MRTIAAIATPTGEGALGVIRISGVDALRVARRLARLPERPTPHRAYLRRLRHRGELLDEALVLYFAGPKSFTGEDVVELQCHGGWVGLRRVLDAVLEAGARIAEPGEFSRRALQNHKLDLLQVEAIADTIHARSEAAHRLALTHLTGRLSAKINALKAPLAHLVALTESAIDFSAEEHVYTLDLEDLTRRLTPIQEGITALLATYDAGRMQHEGVRVAIMGKPNAGKSSLLNTLLESDRALVSELPGTTRDYLEEALSIEGTLFRVVDTAGLRETEDQLESLGVERARAQAERADILLVVVDTTRPGDLEEVRAGLPERPYGVIWNKIDLADPPEAVPGTLACHVSLKTGQRVAGLRPLLLALAQSAGLRTDEDTVLITRARHRGLLLDASDALERAAQAADAALPLELIALDLREGLDALGAMTGAVTREDILASIFEAFCIGK